MIDAYLRWHLSSIVDSSRLVGQYQGFSVVSSEVELVDTWLARTGRLPAAASQASLGKAMKDRSQA